MTSPQFLKRPCRPRDALAAVGRAHPDAWRFADELRAARGAEGLPDWPDWCYLPIGGWLSIASRGHLTIAAAREASILAALGAWRVTQGIYRFDADLYAELTATPVAGDIPHEVLYRLPEWCIYVPTPAIVRDTATGAHHYAEDVVEARKAESGDDAIHGFFAHLEHDVNTKQPELRLVMDSGAGLVPYGLHLGGMTLAESIESFTRTSQRVALDHGLPVAPMPADQRAAMAATVEPLVSLLLYLCSQNAEIGSGEAKPSNPAPKRTKNGWRLFPAERVTTWDVGVRLGAALRHAYHAAEAAGDGTHASPRGHIRRAHWHGFRSGPMKTPTGDAIPTQDRRFDLRWLPPIPVNLDTPDELPATIRPVK